MFVLPTSNCTLATATVSVAVAVRVTLDPPTVAPLDGVVIDMDGAVDSCTVTLNELCDELPNLSVVAQVTVVTPSANVLPEAGLQDTASVSPRASAAVGVAYVTVAPAGDVAEAVMLDGVPLIVGGVVTVPPPP